MLKRLIVGLFVAVSAMFGAALAGQEVKCADQYSLEEQFTLEWAALGGDPHAQFAITQCAFPDRHDGLNKDETVYAMKWLMLASCDFDDNEALIQRDKITRALKEKGDISFRRFGGMSKGEKLNRREKRFVEYRENKLAKMHERFGNVQSKASVAEKASAKAALAEEFSRMGALGLLRLANLSSCDHFDASEEFIAAAWSAANDVWQSSMLSKVYGEASHNGWQIENEAVSRVAKLKPEQKLVFDLEKKALMRTDPSVVAALEEKAALAGMQNFTMAHSDVGIASRAFAGAPVFSVTIAVQYALEALGFVEFINGPDNDYGPSTIEAARKAQAHYGYQQTRWLSFGEIRRTVCDAATRKADPVSFYHLGIMFANGWGFRQDIDRARFAINRADKIMEVRLENAASLAKWKQNKYPAYRSKIDAAKGSLEATWQVMPAHQKSDQKLISNANLCR